MLAGARSIAAIGQWAANAPQHTLARLGARTVCPALGVRQAPCTDTIRRVLTSLDPALLTAPADADRAPFLAMDGKTLRGSALDQAGPAHLLAAMTGHGHIAAQVRVGAKDSEIEHVAALLAGLDTSGAIVSGDALHTQRSTARYLLEQAGAHYLLQVKGNQPRLHAQAKGLPWAQAPVLVRTRESGHGRRETRTAKVLAAGGLEFPHARQVIRIIRTSTEITSVNQLHRGISELRAQGVPIETKQNSYRLSSPPESVDSHQFTVFCDSAGFAMEDGRFRDASELYSQALALWRGSALSGLEDDGLSIYSDFWNAHRLTAEESRIDAELACGRAHELIPGIQVLRSENPLRERLSGQLMIALYRTGRLSESLEVYADLKATLRDSLGVDPPNKIEDIHLGILRNEGDIVLR